MWMRLGLVACLAIAGCATMPARVDLTGKVDATPSTQPSTPVDVTVTKAAVENDIFCLEGVVRRRAGADGGVQGHVDLIVISRDGKALTRLPLDWRPRDIPVTGERQASYLLRIGWVPPQGSTLRVEYDDGSACVTARGLRRAADNLGRMEAGVGLLPYGSPGTSTFLRPNAWAEGIHGPAVAPAEVQGAYSPNYTGKVIRKYP